jgi:hypothetical protein
MIVRRPSGFIEPCRQQVMGIDEGPDDGGASDAVSIKMFESCKRTPINRSTMFSA